LYYYVYDDYGNLRFIIPPAVVSQIDAAGRQPTLADEFWLSLRIRCPERMIIKNPRHLARSQGEQWMVYDARGQTVMTRTATCALLQWLCHLYDAQDRQVMTGTSPIPVLSASCKPR